MKRIRRRKGFIILMVIAMIPLLGVAAVVLSSNSRQILIQTRQHAVRVHAQMAAESGIAWLKAHSPNSVTTVQPIVLQIDHKDKIITCRIELTEETDRQKIFTVTGSAKDKRFSNEYTQQLVLND